MNLLRPLYESWLFEATRGDLAGWKRALLKRALRRDGALRRVALELAEFHLEVETSPSDAPDLRGRLAERIRTDESLSERPLFPSAWVPAGAIAVLVVTAWVALALKPARAPEGESSDQNRQTTAELASLASPTPTAVVSPLKTPTSPATTP